MNNNEFDQLAEAIKVFRPEKVGMLILSIVLLILFVNIIKWMIKPLNEAFPSRRLLISQVNTVFNFFAYIFGTTFLFFSILNPPKEMMIAAGGSMAVALGLSMKDLVASVVAGMILLFDRPFQVGDRVTFGKDYGEIVSIGLRAVKMVTLDDNLVTIPNNRFLNDVVSSGNSGELDMMVVTKFNFAMNADIELAKKLLFEIVATSRFVFLKKPITITLQEGVLGDQQVLALFAKAYVLDVKFEKAFETDIYYRSSKAFRENKLLRPKVKIEMSAENQV